MLINEVEPKPSLSLHFGEDVNISNFKKQKPWLSVVHVFCLPKPHPVKKHVYPVTYTNKMAAIRFISMCSIVWGHCLLGWEPTRFSSVWVQYLVAFFIQLGRIGTINFFIISGFFLKDKIYDYSVLKYVRHRFLTLILPWIIFLTLFVVIELLQTFPVNKLVHGSMRQNLWMSLSLAKSFIFHSAYWFIPISIFSSIVLIIFRQYINKTWFGLLLVGITLFYCVNLYHGWVSANHTESALGYVVFMWLGLQLKRLKVKIKPLINMLAWHVLIPFLLVLFLLASLEGFQLSKIGAVDAFASIRLSNSVLSIVIFITLLKAANISWVSVFKPREYCFGIYLVHCIIIAQFTPLLEKFNGNGAYNNSFAFNMLLRVGFFFTVITLAYVLIIIINKTWLKFIIGNKA